MDHMDMERLTKAHDSASDTVETLRDLARSKDPLLMELSLGHLERAIATERALERLHSLVVRERIDAQKSAVSSLIGGINDLDARLVERFGVGLDLEQVQLLCGTDYAEIEASLDDWDARLGVDVSDLRDRVRAAQVDALADSTLGAPAARSPGPSL